MPLELIAYTLAGIAILLLVGFIAVFMADHQMDDLLRKINRED